MEEKRVMILPDLHWRDTDIKTIGGYCEATNLVSKDIINIVKDREITHIFQVGDWCDKGYRVQHELYSHRNIIQELNELTDYNVFMCLGNHFFLERDTNPELYWIQPNDIYKPVKPIYANKPLIQLVKTLVIDCVQFSFFHYSKEEKMYFRPKLPNVKYHCGIYHDDTVTPTHVRLDEGIHTNVLSSYTKSVYSNIDFAVIGHIHTPVGEVKMQVDGRDIPVDIPGSAAILTTKPSDMHTHIKLPIFSITEETVKKEYVEVSLHTDKLKFFKKKEQRLPDNNFVPEDLRNTENVGELMRRGTAGYISADSFLDLSGISEMQKRMYTVAAAGRLDIAAAVKIIKGKEI